MAGVPDAAAGRDPEDLGREPEEQADPETVDQAADADPAQSHQHSPTPLAARSGVHAGLSWSPTRAPISATSGISATPGTARTGTKKPAVR